MIALSRQRKRINKKLSLSPHILLFLDYDGTLTPIVKTPQQAKIPKRTKKLLLKLRNLPSLTICVVSGRSLSDVRKMVGVKGLVYAGNHGLEGAGRGFRFLEPSVKPSKKVMKRLKGRGVKGGRKVEGWNRDTRKNDRRQWAARAVLNKPEISVPAGHGWNRVSGRNPC